MIEEKRALWDVCEFSIEIKVPGIKEGRLCQIDGSYCPHPNNPEIRDKCPAYRDYKEGRITEFKRKSRPRAPPPTPPRIRDAPP